MKYFKKNLAIILFSCFIFVFFLPFLIKGKLPIPSDTIIGLYHPYRDFYAASYPRGIPFKNFLITDPIRQEYPWRYLAISLEKMKQLPLWNPYSFAGYPLLGNFQSAAWYPLNVIFFILPFHIAWSILIVLQPLLGGLFLYFYLRNLKLHAFACLLGSLAFVFSGFFVSWLEWNTVAQVVIWLPLILLAKDKLLGKWTKKWGAIFLFAECAAVFAGHVQILFYAVCISNAYLFLKVVLKAYRKNPNHVVKESIYIYVPFLLIGIVLAGITAIQWIPTAQFITFSARELDQSYLTQAGWFIPWQHLIQFIIPDFFGNPTTLNYWGVWNYAELVGYIGVLPLIMSIFAIIFRHDKKTYFFSSLVIFSLLFSLPTPLAQVPFALHIPLLSSSQPTRLLFIIDFSLAILAALGFDLFIRKQKGIEWIIGGFALLLAGIWLTALKGMQFFGVNAVNMSIARHNMTLPTVIFILSALLLFIYKFSKKRRHYFVGSIIVICLLLVAFDLVRFSSKFDPFTDKSYLFPSTKAITFLQQNLGVSRVMTTDDRILPPNFTSYYHMQSVDGYDPLYLRNYAELITASNRNAANITPPFGFNRIITPHVFPSRIMNLLGAKYVLSLSEQNDPFLHLVFGEGQTKIYENANAFPRVFFVDSVEKAQSKQAAIEFVMNPQIDLHKKAIITGNIEQTSFTKGEASIVLFSPNKIRIQTQNTAKGFLVSSDIMYPTWHVFIDGKESHIYTTDFALRGIVVPPGQHVVVYEDRIL